MHESQKQLHKLHHGPALKGMSKRVVYSGDDQGTAAKRRLSNDDVLFVRIFVILKPRLIYDAHRKSEQSSTDSVPTNGFSPINVTLGAQCASAATPPAAHNDLAQPHTPIKAVTMLSGPRRRRRDPLIRDYLGLGSKVTEPSSAFASVASSPETQIANAVATAARLSSIVSASPKNKSKGLKQVSKVQRHPTAQIFQITKPGSFARDDLGKRLPSLEVTTDRMRLGGDAESSGTSYSSILKGDSFTCSPPRSERDAAGDRLSIVAPLTSVDNIKRRHGFGYTLCNISTEGPRTTGRQAPTPASVFETIEKEKRAKSMKNPMTGLRSSRSLERIADANAWSEAGQGDHSGDSDFADQDIDDADFEQLFTQISPHEVEGNIPSFPNNALACAKETPASVVTDLIEPVTGPQHVGSPRSSYDALEPNLDAVDEDDMLQLADDLQPQSKYDSQDSASPRAGSENGNGAVGITPGPLSTPMHVGMAGIKRSVCDDHGFITKPIVRSPFPKAIRDRSPVVGANATDSLRVCFRIGEALNVGSQALRSGTSLLLELYARVESSYREPGTMRQHFIFADIWARKGPSLAGVYQRGNSYGLPSIDLNTFVTDGKSTKMCRCIGRLKREGRQWTLCVLNIWEADWDDIEYIRGIVAT